MTTESIREIIENRKFLFFGGKGGVGKTTIATHLASGWPNAGCRCTCPPPTPPASSRSSPTGLPHDQVLIVTYAETTPVAEAAELQEDLRRAGVEPFGWVINASLAASGTRRPAARPARCLEKHRTCVASAAVSPHAFGWCRGARRQPPREAPFRS